MIRSFVVSAIPHGLLLAWVALGGPPAREAGPRNLYEQVIAKNEKKLVWYSFRDRLPAVSPVERQGISRPPRTDAIAKQTIVAGARTAPRTPQLVWTPLPEVQAPKELKSPNLLAFAHPARPQPKVFVPPTRRITGPAALPAPDLTVKQTLAAPPIQNALAKPQPRAFVPPKAQVTVQSPAVLPSAPKLSVPVAAAAPAIGTELAKPQPRAFVPPRAQVGVETPTALPSAPKLSVPVAAAAPPIGTELARPQPRAFVPPRSRAASAADAPIEAPEIDAPAGDAPLTAAIVGLKPVETTEIPRPEGSQPGRFSAGPEKRAEGGGGEPVASARIFVPDLMIRGDHAPPGRPVLMARVAPTARENLAAAMIPTRPAPAAPGVARVASAPDPRLNGRVIYTIAVQMPNVTSYIGSWIMWFAEHEQTGSSNNLRPPVPLRKVDPKYIPAAVEERIEGKVQLSAVIRSDGRVESVSLLKHLDDRLDQSAEEALRKWEFEPAMRNGKAVDVDAVFEIPFRLAPRAAK